MVDGFSRLQRQQVAVTGVASARRGLELTAENLKRHEDKGAAQSYLDAAICYRKGTEDDEDGRGTEMQNSSRSERDSTKKLPGYRGSKATVLTGQRTVVRKRRVGAKLAHQW